MIYQYIDGLLTYGVKKEFITQDDFFVLRNQLMELFCLQDWVFPESKFNFSSIDELLSLMTDYACEKGIISDTAASRDLFDTKIMGLLTPFPREVIHRFNQAYQSSPKEATDWYYSFSQSLNYVRAGRISKDLKWVYDSPYGTLDITINRSKPEKDPRDIAAAKKKQTSAYPKCQLCPENAGYPGHASHPARQNLRPIPLKIQGESWQLQYSPYGYYNEHCIVFNEKHIPMVIDRSVFDKLFDILDVLPHYFVGSNADLPIVGGSILSHEHFQGGRYCFAMEKAPVETAFTIKSFPEISAGVVRWPMSVIRLSSENREQLAACCDLVLKKWRSYSDPEAFVFAKTEGTPHNTITPIARKKGQVYECDLVLRNNITTEDRPLGVFHPNPSLHHIKKENIGLIEVMGLAVLPGRLANELEGIKSAYLQGWDISEEPALKQHAPWLSFLRKKYPNLNKEEIDSVAQNEVGAVFMAVLEDAGVFKRTEAGKKAFSQFLAYLD